MIKPEVFYNELIKNQIEFFSGVPDSLLKDICAYITDNTPVSRNIIAANEGNAVALAAGYFMATGNIPMVYMQNSGLGNAVNPLLSLVDKEVYNIPVLLMIGWRGEPGKKDEPQHIKQGMVTLDLLEAMKIPYFVLSDETEKAIEQINIAVKNMKENNSVYALVVKKGTFEKYTIKKPVKSDFEMFREDAIKVIVDNMKGDEIIVSTTGKTSRELFEYREELKQPHYFDFLTVGSMGHSSQIALGIALAKQEKNIVCFDGDGALLMHMGSAAITGTLKPHNFTHIIFNNGSHESVGGQPTVSFKIDIPGIVKAAGYESAITVSTKEELEKAVKDIPKVKKPLLIEIKVKTGARENLGRPTIKPVDNKKDFMKNLQR